MQAANKQAAFIVLFKLLSLRLCAAIPTSILERTYRTILHLYIDTSHYLFVPFHLILTKSLFIGIYSFFVYFQHQPVKNPLLLVYTFCKAIYTEPNTSVMV